MKLSYEKFIGANAALNNGKKVNKNILTFFNKYKIICEEFCGGPIHIPKPDPENGTPGKNIKIMFINERPGRIGPGKSDLISFKNLDDTARRFKRLFEALDIKPKSIFITNACIYYPLGESYLDTTPTAKEVNFSALILKDQIKRVNPKILVPLGRIALRTLKKVYPQSVQLANYELRQDIGKLIRDTEPFIFPAYHTSNRATMTRKEIKQRQDWQKLKRLTSHL